MNIIDIIFLAILGISLISGMQKGFLASLLATIGFVGAWIAAGAVCMTLSEQFMASQFYVWLRETFTFEEALKGIDASVIGKLVKDAGGNMSQIVSQLTENGIPAAIRDAFAANAASFQTLTVSEYFTQTIWQAAFNVISFAIAFSIAYAVIMLVVNLINNVFRVPKLRGVDALMGGLLGVARGYVVICLICAVLPMLNTALDSQLINSFLGDSALGNFFLNSKSVFKDLFNVNGLLSSIIAKLP